MEADPHGIDIAFVEGPEAGNTNRGVFRLDGDRLEIRLDMNGGERPRGFFTTAGSGHAFETLRRSSRARPEAVTGGTARVAQGDGGDAEGFAFVDSPMIGRLQGEWTAVEVIGDGRPMPTGMVRAGRRTMTGNEVKVTFGGQVMIHALVRLDESTEPVGVDYRSVGGRCSDAIQRGVLRWDGEDVWFCMAPAGKERPGDFGCAVGSGRTVSRWRREE